MRPIQQGASAYWCSSLLFEHVQHAFDYDINDPHCYVHPNYNGNKCMWASADGPDMLGLCLLVMVMCTRNILSTDESTAV